MTLPADGAVQDHQTDLPPVLPAWLGSPVSLVAPTFEHASVAETPLIALPLEQKSFAGPVAEAAACETVNVCPAILRVAVRKLALVLAATDQVTDPLPVPLAGVQVSHAGALLEGVQLQVDAEVTVNVPLPPAAATDALAGEIA